MNKAGKTEKADCIYCGKSIDVDLGVGDCSSYDLVAYNDYLTKKISEASDTHECRDI